MRRAAAVLEVFGVFLAGGLVTDLLIRASGIPLNNPLITLRAGISGPELVTAAGQLLVLLLFQYAGYFLLVVPINWWYRRRGPAAYGLTKAGRSWSALLLAGLATAALTEWPVLGVGVVHSWRPSPMVAWRQAFYDMSWWRWEFWLFAAVLTWAVVPVVEELFYRGYCQRRLAEDWGDGPAIIGTACLFTFAHTQYQTMSAYNAGMILGLLLSAIGFGVVFAWTRSLIPAMLAHAVFDVPMTPQWQGALVVVLMIGALFTWRRGLAAARQVFATGSGIACFILALLGTLYALAGARAVILQYLAVVLVIAAVVLEAIIVKNAQPPSPPPA